MGFHNKGLPLLVKSKSGGCGVEVNADGKGPARNQTNSAQENNVPGNSRKGKGGGKKAKDLTAATSTKTKTSGKDKDKEMTMIEKKIKIIEDLEAFQQALPLFSSMEHHAVHIAINEDGEPTLFECVCGEEVLKEIQFLRHLLYELGALDLRSLSYFVTSKIEILTGKPPSGKGKNLTSIQKKNSEQLPSTSASCNMKGGGSGGEEEMDTDVVQPSLVQQSEENQDLSENDDEATATASSSQSSQVVSSKKDKKKKKGHGHHGDGKKKSSHGKNKLKKKNPKNFYWKNRNGHGIKTKIHIGENQGKFVCYCGNIFKRLSSIDHHVSKKWNKKDYKCEEDGCDQVYQSKFRLKLHFQKNHQSESSSLPEAEPVYSIAAIADNAVEPQTKAPEPPSTSNPNPNPSSSPGSARARPAPAKASSKKKAKAKVTKAVASPKKKTPAVRVSTRRKVWESKEATENKPEAAEEEVQTPQKLQLVCPRDGCGKIFISKKGLRLHVQAQHDKIPVICKKCGIDVKYETCLLPHQRSNKCKANKPKPKVDKKQEKDKKEQAAILTLLGKQAEDNSDPKPLALVKKQEQPVSMDVDTPAPEVTNVSTISKSSETISATDEGSAAVKQDSDTPEQTTVKT